MKKDVTEKNGAAFGTNVGMFIKTGFENGFVLNKCLQLKNRFLSTKLRVLGTFFLTFGLYTLVIGFLMLFFSESGADDASFYVGAILSVCSVPLLLSSGTLSSAMTESVTGRVFCRYTGVRYEVSFDGKMSGHYGVAFIFGVLAGILTFFVPAGTLIGVIFLIALVAVIMFTPEAGLAAGAVCMFFCGNGVRAVILAATAVSFAAKLFRGKRSARLTVTDAAFAVFAVYLILSAVFTVSGRVSVPSFSYFFMAVPYFLIVLMEKECRRATRLMSCIAVSAGIAFSLYNVAFSMAMLTYSVPSADSMFLLDAVNKLPVFENGFGAVCCAAMIPLTVGLSIRRTSSAPKSTLKMCVVADLLYLIISGEYAFVAAGVISAVVLLLLTGKKSIYAFIAFAAALISSSAFFGDKGKSVFRSFFAALSGAFSPGNRVFANRVGTVPEKYLFSGAGFTDEGFEGSFHSAVISFLGVIGAVLIAAFFAAAFCECVRTFIRTSKCKTRMDELNRFGVLVGPMDTRMGAGAPLCAVLSLFISSNFTNIMNSHLTYTLLWVLSALTLAYARAANAEMIKAHDAASFESTPESATANLTGAHRSKMKRKADL